MKCQNCGAKIPDGKIYCEHCGTAIQMVPDYDPEDDISIGTEETEEQDAAKPKIRRTRSRHRAVAVCVAAVALGALIHWVSYSWIVRPQDEDTKADAVAKIVLLEKPRFSLPSGSYKYLPRLTISHPDKNEGSIYYTMDGTTPDEESKTYDDPIEIGEGRTIIRAIFIRRDGVQSEEADGTYEIWLEYPDEPKFSIPGGDYVGELRVSISAGEDCKIYYTTNGEEPSYQSNLYQGPIRIPVGHTVLQAVTVDEDGGMSGIVEAAYNVQEDPASVVDLDSPGVSAGGEG